MGNEAEFKQWFRDATGHDPYPFQIRFACNPPSPSARGEGEDLLVDVPTGLGKTAMAVLESQNDSDRRAWIREITIRTAVGAGQAGGVD
jgi:CRISPR/Cas system-associated endonuclease/helicase Cas3